MSAARSTLSIMQAATQSICTVATEYGRSDNQVPIL
jgi:hypothetical protein